MLCQNAPKVPYTGLPAENNGFLYEIMPLSCHIFRPFYDMVSLHFMLFHDLVSLYLCYFTLHFSTFQYILHELLLELPRATLFTPFTSAAPKMRNGILREYENAKYHKYGFAVAVPPHSHQVENAKKNVSVIHTFMKFHANL